LLGEIDFEAAELLDKYVRSDKGINQ